MYNNTNHKKMSFGFNVASVIFSLFSILLLAIPIPLKIFVFDESKVMDFVVFVSIILALLFIILVLIFSCFSVHELKPEKHFKRKYDVPSVIDYLEENNSGINDDLEKININIGSDVYQVRQENVQQNLASNSLDPFKDVPVIDTNTQVTRTEEYVDRAFVYGNSVANNNFQKINETVKQDEHSHNDDSQILVARPTSPMFTQSYIVDDKKN